MTSLYVQIENNMLVHFLPKRDLWLKRIVMAVFFGIVSLYCCESACGVSDCSELEIRETEALIPKDPFIWFTIFLALLLNFAEIAVC